MQFQLILYIATIFKFSISISHCWRITSRLGLGGDLQIGKKSNSNGTNPVAQTFGMVQFTDQYLEQKLDHSKPTNTETWLQRYFVNDMYYEEGGPVFLYIFGESVASPGMMHTGPQWTTYAKKLDAFCFGLEHRFYGDSIPTSNTSTANLQYLSTEQALADIAYFIEQMNEQYGFPLGTKWILFGGSYAGSLVAWARMKYPHLIHGAVSSSAPLLAKTDFSEYMEVAKRSLKTHSSKCVENIAKANQRLKSVVKSESGRSKVSKLFRLCSPLENNKRDIALLLEILADNVAFAVQYNLKMFSINDVCNTMNEEHLTPLQRYAKVHDKFLELNYESCTYHKYDELIKYLRKHDDKHDYDQQTSRSWIYQTCTEYGFYQTSSKPDDLFGDSFAIDLFVDICKDVFSVSFNKSFIDDSVQRTNIELGGLAFDLTNIVFIHGSLDPWHALGITDKRDDALFDVIFINGTAHCADMHPSSEDDTEDLKTARQKILRILKSWLKIEDDRSSKSKFISQYLSKKRLIS